MTDDAREKAVERFEQAQISVRPTDKDYDEARDYIEGDFRVKGYSEPIN